MIGCPSFNIRNWCSKNKAPQEEQQLLANDQEVDRYGAASVSVEVKVDKKEDPDEANKEGPCVYFQLTSDIGGTLRGNNSVPEGRVTISQQDGLVRLDLSKAQKFERIPSNNNDAVVVEQPKEKSMFSRGLKAITSTRFLTGVGVGFLLASAGATGVARAGNLYKWGLASDDSNSPTPSSNNLGAFTAASIGHITNETFDCTAFASSYGLDPTSSDVVGFCDNFEAQQNKFAYLTGEVTSLTSEVANLNYEVSVLNQNLTDVETLLNGTYNFMSCVTDGMKNVSETGVPMVGCTGSTSIEDGLEKTGTNMALQVFACNQ